MNKNSTDPNRPCMPGFVRAGQEYRNVASAKQGGRANGVE